MSENTVLDWKPVDEEVLTHPFPKLKGEILVVDARVIIVVEVNGVKYEYNKVHTFHLVKQELKP